MYLNNEQEVLAALSKGDHQAFSHIYNLYSRQLLFIVTRIAGNKETAEDIVAESFVKLLSRPGSFESLSKLKSYLFKTGQNACLDWLRAEKRHAFSHAEIKYLSPDAENLIERTVIHAEVLECLYAGIRKLPPKYAEIVERAYIRGESLAEIASAMDLRYKTIQNLKAKAIQELRKFMSDSDYLKVMLFFLSVIKRN
jgi:RNA polymerase sigma factor (sigma-70 family)